MAKSNKTPNASGRKIGKEHWRTFFTGEYLGAFDLPEHDVTVTIREARETEITGKGGIKDVKPVLFFNEFDRGMVLNVTNSQTIEALLGSPEVSDWYGKQILIYSGEAKYQGDTVPAIRVRGVLPKIGKEKDISALSAMVREKLQNYDGDDLEEIRTGLQSKKEAGTLTAKDLQDALKKLKNA